MKSTVLIVCHRCGFERDLDRNEVVTGSWKRSACPCCGYVRDRPAVPVPATRDRNAPEAG